MYLLVFPFGSEEGGSPFMCKYIYPIFSSLEYIGLMQETRWCWVVFFCLFGFKGKAGKMPSLFPFVLSFLGKEFDHPWFCLFFYLGNPNL